MAKQISTADLQSAFRVETPVLIEALPPKYYEQGHLPEAINIPLDSTDAEIQMAIPQKDKMIVTYCTGLTCPNSKKLADRLSQMGYTRVYAYEEGKEGWIHSGNHFERTKSQKQ